MKEVKKTSTVKKTNNTNKKPNTTKKPVNHSAEEVRNAKIVKDLDDKNFLDEDESKDKKIIIVIAISILVIMATIIGLLVGCEKEETKDPEKPKDDVVVPVKVDDDDEEPVVKKTSTSVSNTIKYKITFKDANGEFDSRVVKVKSGKKVSSYTPSGYKDCQYFADKNLTSRYNFKNKVTSSKTIYMVCVLKENNVKYFDSNNVELKSVKVTGTDNEDYIVEDATLLDKNVCSNGQDNTSKFLGWSTSGNSTIKYHANQKINLKNDLILTPVCGKTSVTYTNDPKVADLNDENKTNSVEVGYTEGEIDNFDITTITPATLGLDTPTYFVKTDLTPDGVNGIRKIVSDDVEEFDEVNEVKLSDVKGKTINDYDPVVDDNVDEKEYVFDGWTHETTDPDTKKVKEEEVPTNWEPTETDKDLEANWVTEEEVTPTL